ncbi:L-threonine aldolase [Sulfobacillus thermosulfidooxidans DSM 9293]|uniref:L-threonine aldolase n=1 Tax=Sulfobacillus thermosulfidooxidans (strain DSM 9293 / VKM B-1269 / AT-1) TaxID=929705 RepID=A0A1W1WII9_SULTA|nr:low-specificity L-threonine aldolase [Sulfobacillus thermosulfidooxidans]SMC06065.1 L-threonine aldolase [Sulfobacillus thermosulfidooxidans DSM 9293]
MSESYQGYVDLRSDTVTRPTSAMREAMYQAEVGDDVYGEDPTVNQLEEYAAHLLGKEASLFVPSGTMANQIAILTHTQRGDEVFIHRDNHIYYYEGGAAAMWSQATFTQLAGPEGLMSPEDLEASIRPKNIHHPRPRLLSLENTHNRAGGAALSRERLRPLIEVARRHQLQVHLDGARIANAAIALGVPIAELTEDVDSVSMCLSKGLGAPVGSVIAGSKAYIDQARVYRKWLGGGMRQAGILAAAGIYALDHHIERLADDHRRALTLAQALIDMGYRVDMPSVPTNMVMVDLDVPVDGVISALKTAGILLGAMGPRRLRLVTHLDVDDEGIQRTIDAFAHLTPAKG